MGKHIKNIDLGLSKYVITLPSFLFKIKVGHGIDKSSSSNVFSLTFPQMKLARQRTKRHEDKDSQNLELDDVHKKN